MCFKTGQFYLLLTAVGVNAKTSFNGKVLAVEGLGKLSKPIVQVNAASNWIKNILQEATGKRFSAKPVTLFPGWFVESTKESKRPEFNL